MSLDRFFTEKAQLIKFFEVILSYADVKQTILSYTIIRVQLYFWSLSN